VVFVSGEEAKEVAVGEGAQGFSAVAVVVQTGGREDGLSFVLKAGEGGEGDAVSAVELAKVIKELGFEMRVGAAARRLHRGIGAYSFVCSHIACLPQVVWLGRVRC